MLRTTQAELDVVVATTDNQTFARTTAPRNNTSSCCHDSSKLVPWTTLTVVLIINLLVLLYRSIEGVILLFLAVFPVAVLLFIVSAGHHEDLSPSKTIEFFWAGAIISILVASLLEFFAQLETRPIWRCQRSSHWSWKCDAFFVVVLILSVGLSEELAKILPLQRVKLKKNQMPHTCNGWYRVVDTPYGVFLAGCATAAGFACVENIKYTMLIGAENLAIGINTSLFRGILAIPFHMSCTGFMAAKYAKHIFCIPGGVHQKAISCVSASAMETANGVTTSISTKGWLKRMIAKRTENRQRHARTDDPNNGTLISLSHPFSTLKSINLYPTIQSRWIPWRTLRNENRVQSSHLSTGITNPPTQHSAIWWCEESSGGGQTTDSEEPTTGNNHHRHRRRPQARGSWLSSGIMKERNMISGTGDETDEEIIMTTTSEEQRNRLILRETDQQQHYDDGEITERRVPDVVGASPATVHFRRDPEMEAEVPQQRIVTIHEEGETETRVGEAETRVGETETRVRETETRVRETETRVGVSETRGGEAETRGGEAEARGGEAEARGGETCNIETVVSSSVTEFNVPSCRPAFHSTSSSRKDTMFVKPLSLRKIVWLLSMPVILHGIYDLGLFGAAQFMNTAKEEWIKVGDRQQAEKFEHVKRLTAGFYSLEWLLGDSLVCGSPPLAPFQLLRLPSTTNSHYPALADEIDSSSSSNGGRPMTVKEATESSRFYGNLALIALSVSLMSYLTMMCMWIREWRHLMKWQVDAIPRIWPYSRDYFEFDDAIMQHLLCEFDDDNRHRTMTQSSSNDPYEVS